MLGFFKGAGMDNKIGKNPDRINSTRKTNLLNFYEDNFEREQDIKTKIGSLMNFLSNKEKNIISQYYGLNGCKPKTLDEIGKELGISKERIRQINANSFKKMRSAALSFNMDETIYNND